MQPLQLLTLLRSISNDTLIATKRQEYTPEAIYRIHNQKVQAVMNTIANDSGCNKKVKAKYFAEIRKISLAPMRVKTYNSISLAIESRTRSLTSAVDFMKRA